MTYSWSSWVAVFNFHRSLFSLIFNDIKLLVTIGRMNYREQMFSSWNRTYTNWTVMMRIHLRLIREAPFSWNSTLNMLVCPAQIIPALHGLFCNRLQLEGCKTFDQICFPLRTSCWWKRSSPYCNQSTKALVSILWCHAGKLTNLLEIRDDDSPS